jgi:hypothetical protein
MCAKLRSLFLCFLILSLPLQGVAGVAKFECGMEHHSPMADAGELDATMERMPVAGVHGNGHEHGDASVQDVSAPDDYCDSDARSGCGTCANCSIGASAPPPVMAVTAVEEAVSAALRLFSSSFTGHVSARIERPPRTFS